MSDWLQIAKDAYGASTTYVDANYRKKWEDNLRMFQSRHPSDSKYNTEAYKHRSKIFRPKSRSVVRKNEAAAAAAFFSNIDVISTDAIDQGNPMQVASAAVMKEILNYRLQKTIPWFQILIGGFQDAQTVGVVCSFQYWKYKQKKTKQSQPVMDEQGQPLVGMDGQPVTQEVEVPEIKEDKPCIELIPVENIRIDPGADWLDPIASSPYVIRLVPMYVVDLKSMMDRDDPKTGAPKWKNLDDGQIRSATENKFDSTRQVREGKREDSKDSNQPISDFEIVWVHENFVRKDDEEHCYYTLGTEFLLTEPKPLSEVYFHGERPMTMGVCILETHKIYPEGVIGLGEQLQRETNEVANQRLDNVKLVLNKRFIVKRGSQTDLKSLVRNVPGSVTLATNPESDVKEMEFNDVTQSSYAEQDRINVDYDELVGNFSTSSVQTNRKLNETVGGMGLIAQGANQLTEYTIRTFTETWVEKVLRQLVKLEQYYETDEVVLAIAADRAQLFQRFNMNKVTDELLKQELTLRVNVGMGATDPSQKLNRFAGALRTYGEISMMVSQGMQGVNMEEAGKEIFGLAGYQDGKRFLQQGGPDPQVQQAIQQAHEMITQAQEEMKAEVQRVQSESSQIEKGKLSLQGEAMKNELDRKTLEMDQQAGTNEVAQREIESKERIALADTHIKAETERSTSQDEISLKAAIAERDIDARERIAQEDRDAETKRADADRASAERIALAKIEADKANEVERLKHEKETKAADREHKIKEMKAEPANDRPAKSDDKSSKAMEALVKGLTEQFDKLDKTLNRPRKIVKGPNGRELH